MSQSLKALMAVGTGTGAGWDIGQGRNDLFLGDPKLGNTPQIIDYNGMKILFRPEGGQPYALTLANYPIAYNKIAPFLIAGAYKAVINGNLSLDSYDTIVISTNNSGVITRSTDSGDTWSTPSSPSLSSFALRCIKYVPAWNKWIIPYTTNKCLISSDSGASFSDTTVTGLAINLNTYYGTIRIKVIGSVLVLCTDTKTFVTNDGTTWTEVMATTVGGFNIDGYKKLTIGNNFFVITFFSSGSIRAAYSSDGYTWTLWSSFSVTHDASLASKYDDYGLVYDGARWSHGTSFYEVVPPYGSYTIWSYGIVYSTTATPGTGTFNAINNATSSGGTVIFSDTPTIRYGHHMVGATTYSYENGGAIAAGRCSGVGTYSNPSSVTNFIIANNRLPTTGEFTPGTAFMSSTLASSSADERMGFTTYGNMYKDLQTGSPKFLADKDTGSVSLPAPNNIYNNESAGSISHSLINRLLYTYLYIRLA